MKKLVIDTNVLFQLLKNPINFFGYEVIIPDFIVKEFLYKAKEEKIKNVETFLKKLQNIGFKIVKTDYEFNKNADDLLLRFCKENNALLLTIDKKLKKRAIKEGVKIKELIKGKEIREDFVDFY